MPLPNFFIIGAPKCGTTSLSSWLSEHPNIYMSALKEPHYFNTDEAFRNVRGLVEYKQLFADVGAVHQAVGEASTWYLHSRQAVPKILDMNPGAQLIVCIRNPVDMAYSLHGHFLLTGREHIADFETAWLAADDRLRGRQVGRWVTDPRYLAYPHSCAIGSQLQAVLNIAPRQQVHIVVLDDMREQPAQTYRSCLDFLKLEPDGREDFSVLNRRQPLRSPRIHRLNLYLREIRDKLGLDSFGQGWGAALSRQANHDSSATGLPPQLREQLTDHFSREIHLLWSLCGQEYPAWLNSSSGGRV